MKTVYEFFFIQLPQRQIIVDLTLFSYNRLELRNLHASKKGQVTNWQWSYFLLSAPKFITSNN